MKKKYKFRFAQEFIFPLHTRLPRGWPPSILWDSVLSLQMLVCAIIFTDNHPGGDILQFGTSCSLANHLTAVTNFVASRQRWEANHSQDRLAVGLQLHNQLLPTAE